MKLEELAVLVIEAAEAENVEFMAVGAIAAGAYGVPRSTRDVDLLVSIQFPKKIDALMRRLSSHITFDPQVTFDTLTWGARHVGISRVSPPFKVEFFETFDDPFVVSEFSRRRKVFVPLLNRETWLPTPEDVVVQKLRWGRSKDLDDARDVLAVQGPETLDMAYIEHWCGLHDTLARLHEALAGIPPLD
ncbi:MAG: hypothetical protein EHM17_02685 [Verrucomicrobiaceae bacterium]|nr:MAG: hypothetical protein EHM17_17670 [Verrucomicrobiaceae bacterium]RPJ35429.1 MAG: hypothetical protein EHM17_02685 [Verrucomicrobiaceae bacterium]